MKVCIRLSKCIQCWKRDNKNSDGSNLCICFLKSHLASAVRVVTKPVIFLVFIFLKCLTTGGGFFGSMIPVVFREALKESNLMRKVAMEKLSWKRFNKFFLELFLKKESEDFLCFQDIFIMMKLVSLDSNFLIWSQKVQVQENRFFSFSSLPTNRIGLK